MLTYRSQDGVLWKVRVELPGSSNAMVVFRHPDGGSSRKDRYNWYLSDGPESRSVTARLDKDTVLAALSEPVLAQLFRRSMSVSQPDSLAERMN